MLEYWQRVKTILDKLDKKWVWLSGQVGISQQTLSKMINFDRYPDAYESDCICKVLNVTNEYLLSGNDPVKPDMSDAIKTIESGLEKLKKL